MADNRFAKSLLVVMLLVFILLGYIPLVSAADNEQKAKQRVVVSMGDSYSSGEGIDDFYGSEKKVSERVKDRDWLAHRSKNSWPGMLMLKDMPEGKSLKDYKVNDAKNHNPDNEFEWYFVASSGAETKDLCYGINDKGENKKGQKKEYKKGDYEGKAYLPKQIETLTELRKKGVTPDYITLTIGGNDAGFETIIKESILCGEGYGSANVLRAQFAYTWSKFYEKNGIRDNIKKTYKTISKATDNKATIIVAGYPKLLSTFGHPGEFALRECNIINDNVSKFNNAIKDIVDECSSGGMNIVFVSVEDTFNGHGAYSINEYLNGVVYIPKEQDLKDSTVSAYSMHPNIKGARAYAQCVQNKLMELEKWSAKIPNKDIEGGARAIESKLPHLPEITKDTSDNEPWRKAYIDFLTTDEDVAPYEDEYGICTKYTLIYLDDDKVIKESLSRTGSEYIERSGLVYTNTGHMEYYPLTITKLENGVFTVIGKGVSYISEEDYKKRAEDENYHPSLTYEWEGKKVTEDQYNAKVAELYDLNKSKVPDNYYTYDEFVKLLKSGK